MNGKKNAFMVIGALVLFLGISVINAPWKLIRDSALAQSKIMYVVPDSGLRLRKAPDTNSKVEAVLLKWETVQVLEISPKEEVIGGTTGKWMKVKLGNYRTGWAFGAFLADYSPSVKDNEIRDAMKNITIKIGMSKGGLPYPADSTKDGQIFGQAEGVCGVAKSYGGIVKDGRVYFIHASEESPQGGEGSSADDPCGRPRTKLVLECWIDGDEILKTPKSGTLKTTARCGVLSKQVIK